MIVRPQILLSLLMLGSLCATAQTIAPARPSGAGVPHRLTLAEAEALLLQRNLAVIAARYQVDSSRAARLIASYKPNPVLTIGAEQINLGHAFFPNLVHTDPSLSAQTTYTVRLDKIIERGGKRELRTEQANFQLKAAEAQMLDAIRAQLFQLRQAFTNAELARENLVLAEQTEQQYAQTERLTEAKVENGDLAKVELYRAQAARLQYEQAVLQARASYEQATRDVLNLLGARAEDVQTTDTTTSAAAPLTDEARAENTSLAANGPQSLRSAPLEIVGRFDDRPVIQSLVELRHIALTERPDVIAVRNLYQSANSGLALANALRVRDIAVGTEYQRVGTDHSVGVTVSIPLFIYNNQRAAITQAEAQRRAVEAQLRQAEMQAITDLEKAWQAYLNARRMLDIYNAQTLSRVEKLREVATHSYREGASSLFELLDAQRSYNQSITAYNQARADYQMSLWQLEQAIGRPLQ